MPLRPSVFSLSAVIFQRYFVHRLSVNSEINAHRSDANVT